jgi:thiol-disulfide isomerase/thioredoxin
MKKLGFLFFIASLLTSSIVKCEETSLEDDVIVLDSTNFKQAIESHFTLMVEFYAPWCTHCKTLAPEYSQAARILKYSDPPYFMAKVDATVEK